MNEIRFNRNYSKLHGQTKGVLIKVMQKPGKDLPKDFISYDTDDKYPIEQESIYLVLYFIGDKYIPFTTLRRWDAVNIVRYCGKINEMFDIIVEEE